MAACLADDLNCDGIEEDCDGTIDDGCTMCGSDAECLASETYTGGMCMPR